MKYEDAREICRAAFADAVAKGAGDVQQMVAMQAGRDPKLTQALHIVATEEPQNTRPPG